VQKSDGNDNPPFCAGALTIVSRKVLICSQNMPEQDAYFLAMRAASALSLDRSEIVWSASPPEAQRRVDIPLSGYHPGAQLLMENKEPSTLWKPAAWPTWVQMFVGRSSCT
jgi:hypothetical protein